MIWWWTDLVKHEWASLCGNLGYRTNNNNNLLMQICLHLYGTCHRVALVLKVSLFCQNRSVVLSQMKQIWWLKIQKSDNTINESTFDGLFVDDEIDGVGNRWAVKCLLDVSDRKVNVHPVCPGQFRNWLDRPSLTVVSRIVPKCDACPRKSVNESMFPPNIKVKIIIFLLQYYFSVFIQIKFCTPMV